MQQPRLTSAVLIEKDGKFLLGKRNKATGNGLWVIPGGGVDFGETTQQAAIREIKEETNLDIELLNLICHKEVIATHANYHSVVFFYKAKPLHSNIWASDDLSEIKYLTIEEIKQLTTAPSVQQVFEELGLWSK
jgi:8-oxo-dGTP diphosphatase